MSNTALTARIMSLVAAAVLFPMFVYGQQSVMLAKTYDQQSVHGWLASEKLDGVRGYWDGTRMLSKNMKPFHAPANFIDGFPPFAIDGELYAGTGSFHSVSAAVRTQHNPDWTGIRLHVFDVPHAKGGLLQRLSVLQTWLDKHPNPRIVIIAQTRINTIEQAQTMRISIEDKGGEGVMLRHPDAPYPRGRSDTILKLKKADDAECIVVGYTAGKGKYTGKTGALSCRLPSGDVIAIGSGLSDADRDTPPPLGSTITFRYNGWTYYGKPRFPRFWRIRHPVNTVSPKHPE